MRADYSVSLPSQGLSSPVFVQNSIFISSYDGLYRLDGEQSTLLCSCRPHFKHPHNKSITGDSACNIDPPAVSGSHVFAHMVFPTGGPVEHKVLCMDLDGQSLWEYTYRGGIACGEVRPDGQGGCFILASAAPEDPILYKFSALGELEWQKHLGSAFFFETHLSGKAIPIAIDKGEHIQLLALCPDASLSCIADIFPKFDWLLQDEQENLYLLSSTKPLLKSGHYDIRKYTPDFHGQFLSHGHWRLPSSFFTASDQFSVSPDGTHMAAVSYDLIDRSFTARVIRFPLTENCTPQLFPLPPDPDGFTYVPGHNTAPIIFEDGTILSAWKGHRDNVIFRTSPHGEHEIIRKTARTIFRLNFKNGKLFVSEYSGDHNWLTVLTL